MLQIHNCGTLCHQLCELVSVCKLLYKQNSVYALEDFQHLCVFRLKSGQQKTPPKKDDQMQPLIALAHWLD